MTIRARMDEWRLIGTKLLDIAPHEIEQLIEKRLRLITSETAAGILLHENPAYDLLDWLFPYDKKPSNLKRPIEAILNDVAHMVDDELARIHLKAETIGWNKVRHLILQNIDEANEIWPLICNCYRDD